MVTESFTVASGLQICQLSRLFIRPLEFGVEFANWELLFGQTAFGSRKGLNKKMI